MPLAVAGSCIFAWAVGLHGFVQSLPRVAEVGSDVEAVIVLTGGQGRLDTGFRLLQELPEARLLVSGVGAGVRAADLVVPPEIVSRVDLGRMATDTVGNAVESRRWAVEREIRSAALVTSALHLPRSLLLFQHLAPDLEVVPYPVSNTVGERRSLTWYAAAANEFTKGLVTRAVLVLVGPGYFEARH